MFQVSILILLFCNCFIHLGTGQQITSCDGQYLVGWSDGQEIYRQDCVLVVGASSCRDPCPIEYLEDEACCYYGTTGSDGKEPQAPMGTCHVYGLNWIKLFSTPKDWTKDRRICSLTGNEATLLDNDRMRITVTTQVEFEEYPSLRTISGLTVVLKDFSKSLTYPFECGSYEHDLYKKIKVTGYNPGVDGCTRISQEAGKRKIYPVMNYDGPRSPVGTVPRYGDLSVLEHFSSTGSSKYLSVNVFSEDGGSGVCSNGCQNVFTDLEKYWESLKGDEEMNTPKECKKTIDPEACAFDVGIGGSSYGKSHSDVTDEAKLYYGAVGRLVGGLVGGILGGGVFLCCCCICCCVIIVVIIVALTSSLRKVSTKNECELAEVKGEDVEQNASTTETPSGLAPLQQPQSIVNPHQQQMSSRKLSESQAVCISCVNCGRNNLVCSPRVDGIRCNCGKSVFVPHGWFGKNAMVYTDADVQQLQVNLIFK